MKVNERESTEGSLLEKHLLKIKNMLMKPKDPTFVLMVGKSIIPCTYNHFPDPYY